MKRFASVSALVLMAAGGLVGCATGPDYRRPDLALPETWRLGDATTNSLADLPVAELYRDPVLNDLIATALSNSPDVRAALARIEQAAAALRIQRADYWPALNGSGSYTTARKGNLISAVGMLVAIVVTLFDHHILHWTWIVAGLGVGSLIGGVWASRVAMTGMPELVALFNGFGGLASVAVGWGEYLRMQAQIACGEQKFRRLHRTSVAQGHDRPRRRVQVRKDHERRGPQGEDRQRVQGHGADKAQGTFGTDHQMGQDVEGIVEFGQRVHAVACGILDGIFAPDAFHQRRIGHYRMAQA